MEFLTSRERKGWEALKDKQQVWLRATKKKKWSDEERGKEKYTVTQISEDSPCRRSEKVQITSTGSPINCSDSVPAN